LSHCQALPPPLCWRLQRVLLTNYPSGSTFILVFARLPSGIEGSADYREQTHDRSFASMSIWVLLIFWVVGLPAFLWAAVTLYGAYLRRRKRFWLSRRKAIDLANLESASVSRDSGALPQWPDRVPTRVDARRGRRSLTTRTFRSRASIGAGSEWPHRRV
jgi:hypothetical protein